jgi:MFS family permease
MNISFNQLLSWKGTVSREAYLVWGLVLLVLKYNIDRFIALSMGRSTWFLFDYFQADRTITQAVQSDQTFYLILLAAAVPFIWSGTVLCLKRLRDAALPPWLVVFFFVPFINLILFVLLAAIPGRSAGLPTSALYIARLIPRSRWGSAMFSLGAALICSLLITLFLVNYLEEYGWSLFVGIPFMLGFGSVLLYGYHRRLRYREALGVALTAVMFFTMIIFALAIEGFICLAMALPIFILVSLVGATIGYAIHGYRHVAVVNSFLVPVFLIPVLALVEHKNDTSPPVITVQTEIVINASRQQVWDQLVAFGRIEEEPSLMFRAGIAYPIHAQIDGRGVGAVRKCNFTTGSFIEPITIWNEPSLLEFSVIDQPPPMSELTIYSTLAIPHLDGYFRSSKGQFLLERLSDNSTQLVGTTWYSHDVWPNGYWQLWSDMILHQIHLRVLRHIKGQAERKSADDEIRSDLANTSANEVSP